jgi:hypothetical protein
MLCGSLMAAVLATRATSWRRTGRATVVVGRRADDPAGPSESRVRGEGKAAREPGRRLRFVTSGFTTRPNPRCEAALTARSRRSLCGQLLESLNVFRSAARQRFRGADVVGRDLGLVAELHDALRAVEGDRPVWGTRPRAWAPPRAVLIGSRVGFNGLAALELRGLRTHRLSARSLPGRRRIESRSRQAFLPRDSEPANAAHRVTLGPPVTHVRRAGGFIPKLAEPPPTSPLAVFGCLWPGQLGTCGREKWGDWLYWAPWAGRSEQRKHREPHHDSREDDRGHLLARWPQASRHFAHNSRSFPARGHRQTTVPRRPPLISPLRRERGVEAAGTLGESLRPEPGDVSEDHGAELGEWAVGAVFECPEDGLPLGDFQSEDHDFAAVGVLEPFGLLVEADHAESSGEVEDVTVGDRYAGEPHASADVSEHTFRGNDGSVEQPVVTDSSSGRSAHPRSCRSEASTSAARR